MKAPTKTAEVGSQPVHKFFALERTVKDGTPWWTVVECEYQGDKIINRKQIHSEDTFAYAREAYINQVKRQILVGM